MKILANAIPNNTYGDFSNSIKKNDEWFWWSENNKPAFDIFDEIKPDVVFTMSGGVSQALKKCIEEFNPKVIYGYYKKPFVFMVQDGDDSNIYDFEKLVDDKTFKNVEKIRGIEESIQRLLTVQVLITGQQSPELTNIIYDFKPNIRVLSEYKWNVTGYLGNPSKREKCVAYNLSDYVFVDSVTEAMRVIRCKSLPITHLDEVSDNFDRLIPVIKNVEELKDMIHQHEVNSEMKQGLINHLYSVFHKFQYTYSYALMTLLKEKEKE